MNEPRDEDRPETAAGGGPTTAEVLDLLRRERADFRNYQRRIADERAADAESIRGRVLEPLFPLLDDLRRAFAEVPSDLQDDPWAQGIAMMRSRLEATLAGLGLEVVGAVGEPFDPARHEAISHQPDPMAPGQDVAVVIRPGYRLGERLLRPAQVVVKGPPGEREGEREHGPSDATPAIRQPEPVTPGRPNDDPPAGG